MTEAPAKLILASGSPYRRRLLERLALPFFCVAPDVDETPEHGESAEQAALRLARRKGAAVAARWPGAWIISSDQTAALGASILGKPGTPGRAIQQLLACRGRHVTFYTAVVLSRGDEIHAEALVESAVRFRDLPREEIERYVDIDKPLDCAGSFRWEGIGICLFDALTSDDPTALEGLPLISVARMLRDVQLNPLLA
jgi:septum formation protein